MAMSDVPPESFVKNPILPDSGATAISVKCFPGMFCSNVDRYRCTR